MRWTMATVGDIMLDRMPKENSALALLRSADFASANLEVPLAQGGHPADKPVVLRAGPDVAEFLPDIGLNLVSFANNHSLDYGPQAFLDTIDAVRSAGVRVTGAGADLGSALRPVITDVSGCTVACLGFASTLPTGFAATPNRPGIAPLRIEASILMDGAMSEEQPGTSPFVATQPYEEDLKQAAEVIRKARENADVVVVNIHWGVPPGFSAGFQGILAQYQRPLAHALVQAGASVLVGHHPHALHGIEVLEGNLVLYSVGHFMFHALAADKNIALSRPGPPYQIEAMMVPEIRETGIFLLTFDENRLTQVEIVPCNLNEEGESELATKDRALQILERVRELSSAFGTDIKVERERGVILL